MTVTYYYLLPHLYTYRYNYTFRDSPTLNHGYDHGCFLWLSKNFEKQLSASPCLSVCLSVHPAPVRKEQISSH